MMRNTIYQNTTYKSYLKNTVLDINPSWIFDGVAARPLWTKFQFRMVKSKP
jgi:hypothetical protein